MLAAVSPGGAGQDDRIGYLGEHSLVGESPDLTAMGGVRGEPAGSVQLQRTGELTRILVETLQRLYTAPPPKPHQRAGDAPG